MAKKKNEPAAPLKQSTPGVVVEVVDGPKTDSTDSAGNAKEQELIGPRGVGVPVGIKPEPPAKIIPTNDVTDKVDSAGAEIADEHGYVPGPRGEFAAKHIRDSYRS